MAQNWYVYTKRTYFNEHFFSVFSCEVGNGMVLLQNSRSFLYSKLVLNLILSTKTDSLFQACFKFCNTCMLQTFNACLSVTWHLIGQVI